MAIVLLAGIFGSGAVGAAPGQATGTWRPAGSLRTARAGHSATLMPDGKVLVAGGCALLPESPLSPAELAGADRCSTPTPSAEIYDPSTNAWLPTQDANVARVGHSAVLLKDGKVLLMGGNVDDGVVETYDPHSGAWTKVSSAPASGLARNSAVLLGAEPPALCGSNCGKVLVVPRGLGPPASSAQLFDPASGVWEKTGPFYFVAGRFSTATLLEDGKVLLFGGTTQGGRTASQIYSPTTNTWNATGGEQPLARLYHSATLLKDGRVLMAQGRTTSGVGTSELYTPAGGVGRKAASPDSWAPDGRGVTARSGHVAALLASGKVLVAGGVGLPPAAGPSEVVLPFESTKPAFTPSAEIYDPKTGHWQATGAMSTTRGSRASSDFTSTLMKDGTVLVAGGAAMSDGKAVSLGTAEIYAPAASDVTPPNAAAPPPGKARRTGSPYLILVGAGLAALAGIGFILFRRRSGGWAR